MIGTEKALLRHLFKEPSKVYQLEHRGKKIQGFSKNALGKNERMGKWGLMKNGKGEKVKMRKCKR